MLRRIRTFTKEYRLSEKDKRALPESLVDARPVVLLLDDHDEWDGGGGGGHEGVGDPSRVQREGRDVEQEEEDLDRNDRDSDYRIF